MEIEPSGHRYRIILLFVSAFLLLAHLGKPEVNIMEARNFVSAREMVQNNQFMLTTLNNEPRYQKPPLPTWLTAIAGYTAGFDSIFFLRLPVALITLMMVFFYFHLCREIGLSEKFSMIFSLILITSFYIFFSGRDNQWDMYTHSFMLGCIFFLWKLLNHNQNRLYYSLMAGLFFGFSVLSKGPISLYSLLLPFLIGYGIVYGLNMKKIWPWFLLFLITGITTGLSWYLYVRLIDPENFNAIIGKETDNWTNYEIKPFYYYWSFFLQSGLWAIPSLVALCYPYLRKRVKNLKAYKFAVVWTLSALILMSIIPEKKVRYLVPVLIPLALATGFYIEYLIVTSRSSLTKSDRIVSGFAFGIPALAGLIYPVAVPVILGESLKDYLLLYMISSLIMTAISVFIISGIVSGRYTLVFNSMIVLFSIAVIALFPMSSFFMNNPDYVPARCAAAISEEEGIKTYRLSEISPELVWDYGDSIPLVKVAGSEIIFPAERKFGLLVAESDSLAIRNVFGRYNMDKRCRVDMYPRKKHKKRLVKDFYIVKGAE